MMVHLRTVKSFVRRTGRMGPLQKSALTDIWPLYGLEFKHLVWDLEEIFPNQAPLVVEIGFGEGSSLLTMAENAPQLNFIGIEVYRNGVAKLLRGIAEKKLTNLRVVVGDAVSILETAIAANSLYRLQLYFPDPWPKKRHHKRRLVQTAFVNLLASRLVPGGIFHMATDWQDYAKTAAECIQACPAFKNCAEDHALGSRPAYRPETKFEKRGKQLGHGIWDLMFERINQS